MYYPSHRPQLTGVPTESVDCGVRATQMGLDWLSKGSVIRSVAKIRELGGMGSGPTNYFEWDEVIDKLGGRTEGFSGEKSNSWDRAAGHMNDGGAIIVAVDYGEYRSRMQSKSGSLTFDGAHAILFAGSRSVKGQQQWRSFDSLLDGRYRGCPNGPVWVPQWKVRKAMEALGAVFTLLLHRDPGVEDNEPGDLLPAGGITLSDILSDLIDISSSCDDRAAKQELDVTISGMAKLLGVIANPEADASTRVSAGISVEGG